MLARLNNPKLLVGTAVVIVVAGLLIAFAVNSGSAGDRWQTRCASPPSAPAGRQANLVAEARKALLDTGNEPRLGIEIVDLDACAVETRWKADQPQPAASVVKLLIALDLIDRSGVPTGSEATAVRTMLAASDDHVASHLWQQNGGPEIVRRQVAKLRLTHTTPPADAGQWGSTRMSPTDVVAVYRYLTAKLPEAERGFLTEAMENAPRTAVDGFDQHFGIPRAFPGTAWAVKQGWGSSEGRRVLNTTGLVRTTSRTYAIAVMASWNDAIDWPAATSAVTTALGALKGSLGAGKA
ncbi:hypothetical protein [Amycolatopsis sp. NPDC004169]|uniref:hypothetical protein n=1 Tax=Amycolatopsis sp. NPDC004169 TaxID=3154453 RepID=UPI0033A8514D